MKALTICQPYAQLIISGEKRVENRTWPTGYRGPLYIHAGKSRDWLDDIDLRRFPNMPFGAVVGIAELVNCVHIDRIEKGDFDQAYPWLLEHEHTEGPWCWILDKVCAIGPWPWRGAQGLFEIDSDELNRVANKELGIAEPVPA
jgi:hypothetical protein